MYIVHLKFLVRAFSACTWVCAFSTCARCVRARGLVAGFTGTRRGHGNLRGGLKEQLRVERFIPTKVYYPSIHSCQCATRWLASALLDRDGIEKLTSYFQIMHFVWGIFHFPSVFYFPTTSGLSQLLKCPDHNIAAIGKHLHILDRLSSLRRVAYNKDDNKQDEYFGFFGMVCLKGTIF